MSIFLMILFLFSGPTASASGRLFLFHFFFFLVWVFDVRKRMAQLAGERLTQSLSITQNLR
jgi:hypothetical protein